MTEGAGADLYSADQAGQVKLLEDYTKYICATSVSDCHSPSVFAMAAMNDIDRRCDGYLTWLDARRRDKEPVLAEINALSTATHSIMTVTGVTPKSLDIVTAAFGLGSATYNNWNSRLLIAVNQSTVQDIVYTSQGQYREKIKTFPINDFPTAIYLLRNYLRLCMPITIEANINTTSTLVQSGDPLAATHGTVVNSVKSAPVVRSRGDFALNDTSRIALTNYLYPRGIRNPDGTRNRPEPSHAADILKYMRDHNIAVNVQAFLAQESFSPQRRELAIQLKLISGP